MSTNQINDISVEEEESLKEVDPQDEVSVTKNLKYEDFFSYMKAGLNKRKITIYFDKQMKYLFDGIDLDGINYVNTRDADFLLLCFYQSDYLNITKVFFCGADKDRDRKISISSISDTVNYLCYQKITKDQFESKCVSEYGQKKKELKFFEFYKIMTDKDIDENYDPYEGRIPEKSACCILI